MFTYWPDNKDWSWHLLRPIAESIYGGGEFNECIRAAERIRPGAIEGWFSEWFALAQSVEALGEEAEAKRHELSAKEHYLRACGYYRWAEFFLDPADDRRVRTYEKCISSFRKAGRHFSPPLEMAEIPYDGAALPGYFYPAKGASTAKTPGLLYVAGADVLKEELYFLGGRAAIERGLSLLVMDGPGQGETLRYRKIYSRYDYEVPIMAAFDYLEKRPEVNPSRMALMGRSFGGYYAARAAAFEKRIKACAIFGAFYSGTEVFDTYPPLRRQFQWLLGARDQADARRKLEAFNLGGVVDKISCPILIVHGEDDFLVPASHARRTYDEARCQKEMKIYNSGEPGAVHCQYDSFPQTIPFIMDWLCDKLS